MKNLRVEKESKKQEENMSKLKAKENVLKAKEYAQKQRMLTKSGGVNAAKKLEAAEKKKQESTLVGDTYFHKEIVTQNHLNNIVNITEDDLQKPVEIKRVASKM